MITRTLIVLTLLSLIPIHVCAEYYKYKDANGVIRYTDNLLNVPREQRENIQAYQEVVAPEPDPGAPDERKEDATSTAENLRIEQLNSERESLEELFKELEAEQKSLMASSPNPQEAEAVETHRKRAEAFNQKVKSYEEQRKIFQSKIDAFNAEIENQ
jgi:hypothetical protein